MDILDILDKKVKDTVEAKVRLEEKLVNLNSGSFKVFFYGVTSCLRGFFYCNITKWKK